MCPPGLPIVMAPLRWIHAELIVVPLLGAFAVWLTFVFGRRLAAAPAGAASAVLVACSPIFLYQIVQPMTDVRGHRMVAASPPSSPSANDRVRWPRVSRRPWRCSRGRTRCRWRS